MSAEKRQSNSIPVHALLTGDNSALAPLCKRAGYLQQLNLELCSHLSAPLNTHCKLANITANAVILHADSPAWAARLRYCMPDILRLIQNRLNLTGIKSIRIKIMFPDEKSHSNHRRTLTMSTNTARLLADSARSITDPALRSSLLRLSSHAD